MLAIFLIRCIYGLMCPFIHNFIWTEDLSDIGENNFHDFIYFNLNRQLIMASSKRNLNLFSVFSIFFLKIAASIWVASWARFFRLINIMISVPASTNSVGESHSILQKGQIYALYVALLLSFYHFIFFILVFDTINLPFVLSVKCLRNGGW